MLLLLIRHGMTAHVGTRLSGWMSGVGLSAEGRQQAEDLVRRLDGVALDAIYSSPLERAVTTAQPLARARRMRVRQREELGEVVYGDIEGKTLKSLAKSTLWRKLGPWPSDVRFPGGESLRETQARAVGAVEDLRARHPGGTIAVFSHGDWIRLTVAHYAGTHIDLYRRFMVDPASVTAIQFLEQMPVIRCVNETGRLASLAIPRRHR